MTRWLGNNRTWLVVAVAVMAFAGAVPAAQAQFELTASNLATPDQIYFDGKGSFAFQSQVVGKPTTEANIVITGRNPGVTTSLGDLGTLGGNYSIGKITTLTGGGVTVETALVTPNTTKSGPPYQLTFTDHLGKVFSGNVAFLDITTTQPSPGSPQGGVVTGRGTINLTNVTYAGNEADLKAFLGPPNGGTASVSFTFVLPKEDLKYLASHKSNTGFTLNISPQAVPAPAGLLLAAIGAPLCGAFGWMRRRKTAVAA